MNKAQSRLQCKYCSCTIAVGHYEKHLITIHKDRVRDELREVKEKLRIATKIIRKHRPQGHASDCDVHFPDGVCDCGYDQIAELIGEFGYE